MKEPVLAGVAAASATLLVAPYLGGPAGDALFVVAAAALPFLLVLVALGRRVPRRLVVAIVGLGFYYAACLLALLVARGRVAELPWVGGLPLATAVAVYGIFLLPIPVVGLVFARGFDHLGFRRRPAAGDTEDGR